jgi:hypothetical protein
MASIVQFGESFIFDIAQTSGHLNRQMRFHRRGENRSVSADKNSSTVMFDRRRSNRSRTSDALSSFTARRIAAISAGKHQKSPQTQRIAAPICWSANRLSVILPIGIAIEPNLYRGTETRILIEIAMTIITTLLISSAPAWPIGESLGRNGADGTIWIQNKSPARKNVGNINPMCKFSFAITGLKRLGNIHATITTLKKMMLNRGDMRVAPITLSG